MRSPRIAIIAGAVAVALFVTAGGVAVTRFPPFGTVTAEGNRAPAAFPTQLVATSSPAVSRGATVSLSIRAVDTAELDRVEVWDGSRLYWSVHHPATTKLAANRRLRLALDFVPLVAGVHTLTVLAVDAKGRSSLSAPIELPILDRSVPRSATAQTPARTTGAVRMQASAGDTVASVAARLGVDPGSLAFPVSAAGSDPAVRLAAGTVVTAPLIGPDAGRAVPGLTALRDTMPMVTASVSGCTVSVTAAGHDDLALYAATPTDPAFVRVGEVGDGRTWSSDSLPLGVTMFTVYRAGTTDAAATLTNGPAAPVAATIPDTCLSSGWTGNAKIVDGVLLTDTSIDSPYAFVSVDGGAWVRAPGASGTTLATGTMNDVRQWVNPASYNQIDLEVWTGLGGDPKLAASGDFCRSRLRNSDAAHGTKKVADSGCAPADTRRVQNGPTPALQLGWTSTSQAVHQTGIAVVAPPTSWSEVAAQGGGASPSGEDPGVQGTVAVDSNVPVTFTATATGLGASRIHFQFSLFPFTGVVADQAAAVLETEDVDAGSADAQGRQHASVTVSPWKWRALKADVAQYAAWDDDHLDLDDEIGLSVAKARLAAGKNLVNRVYVRAIAFDQHVVSAGQVAQGASGSLALELPEDTGSAKITGGRLLYFPGVDSSALTGPATRHECFTIDRYPEPESDPGPFGPREVALAEFPESTAAAVHCLDPNADAIREQEDEEESSDCGLFCVLTAVIIGGVLGFAFGGPLGAGFGAGLASVVALTDPALAAEFSSSLKQLWDLVAQTYNGIISSVNSFLANINPLCLAVSAASSSSSTATNTCHAIVESVQAAIYTDVTGLPPSLPTSVALEAIASGDAEALVEQGIDLALSETVGLHCGDFTIAADDADEFQDAVDLSGASDAQHLLDAARTSDGSLSGCTAIARSTVAVAKSKLENFHSTLMSQELETDIPVGMVVTPVTNRPPGVLFTSLGLTTATAGQTCPATLTLRRTLNATTEGAHPEGMRTLTYAPIAFTLTARSTGSGSTGWSGYATLPILPGDDHVHPTLVIRDTPAEGDGSPKVRVDVDSPCLSTTLSETALAVDMTGVDVPNVTGPEFVTDQRSVVYYH